MILGLLACDGQQPYRIISSWFNEISGGAVLGDSFYYGRRENLSASVTRLSWTTA